MLVLARASHPGCTPATAGKRHRAYPHRASRERDMLRVRWHILGEIPGHLQRDSRRQAEQYSRYRGGCRPCGRPRLPDSNRAEIMAEATISFKKAASEALADGELQRALQNVKTGFVAKRAAAKSRLPEFEALRAEARAIKDHTLTHLDLYLEAYESKIVESGGKVHFAPTAADARDIVLGLCHDYGAKLVGKGKSMVSEEIAVNAHLQAAGIEVVETDLGEYIVQLKGEAPSHIN